MSSGENETSSIMLQKKGKASPINTLLARGQLLGEKKRNVRTNGAGRKKQQRLIGKWPGPTSERERIRKKNVAPSLGRVKGKKMTMDERLSLLLAKPILREPEGGKGKYSSIKLSWREVTRKKIRVTKGSPIAVACRLLPLSSGAITVNRN